MITAILAPLLAAVPVFADWGADTRLTNAAGGSYSTSMAVFGNNVHVAWHDIRHGHNEF